MNPVPDWLRRARLRALLRRQLANAEDVWRAYRGGGAIPPLRFRDGLTFFHGEGDAPVHLFFEVFANGCYRRRLALAGEGTIVDIGANIGAFTLDCARRFPRARLEAYEPNPAAYAMLRRNIDANALAARVRTYPEAVGGGRGMLTLWGHAASLSASGYGAQGGPSVTVPMVDLATVLERAGPPVDAVKIDAEGAEADILEGGRAVLVRVAAFVGEYHEDLVPGVLDRCRAVLTASGFEFDASRTHRCGPQFHARRAR